MPNTNSAASRPLILASSSRYRRMLLDRLMVPYTWTAPEIDETKRDRETAKTLSSRLAREKAAAVATQAGSALIIGADQVAARGTTLLGKPGDHETAKRQLLESADQEVCFYTAVCLIDPARGTTEQHIDETRVSFRSLQPEEIDRYLKNESPFDCAGGFKAEGLGISLFWRVQNEDPTALMGLPLIWLAAALRRSGLAIP